MEYDFETSEAETAAALQREKQALDLLYVLGCEFPIKQNDMKALCSVAGVTFDQLMNHSL